MVVKKQSIIDIEKLQEYERVADNSASIAGAAWLAEHERQYGAEQTALIRAKLEDLLGPEAQW